MNDENNNEVKANADITSNTNSKLANFIKRAKELTGEGQQQDKPAAQTSTVEKASKPVQDQAPTNKADKKSMVKGAIGLGVLALIATYALSSHSPKDLAKEYAKDKAVSVLQAGKEKLAEKKAEVKGKVEQKMDSMNYVPGSGIGSVNQLKDVQHDEYISIGNVSTTAEAADLDMRNAIKSANMERVKFLLDSGVKPQGKFFYLTAASKLDVNYNADDFPYYNSYIAGSNDEFKQQMAEKQALEKRREDIYNFLLDLAYKNKSAELIHLPMVFLNKDVPSKIRKDALLKYLETNADAEMTKSLGDIKAQGEAQQKDGTSTEYNKTDQLTMHELETIDSDLAEKMKRDSIYTGLFNQGKPWMAYVHVLNEELIDNAVRYANQAGLMADNVKNDSKYHIEVANLEIPRLDVASMNAGAIKYSETTNAALWYYGQGKGRNMVSKYDFLPLYKLNVDLDLLNTIVKSKKVNLNAQDDKGNSILHYLCSDYSANYRSLSVIIRYYLDNGVNPNLLNKQGMSAYMIAVARQANTSDGKIGELDKAFNDKEYN
ncbi:ankyrin repeat domain-containing protein [Burkholderia cenocepacia]|uniref:Ankyrin repeat domain-containing protein n=1 Tax=Burkholderia cenocepacia TaxID=95486 RepID=A0ABD4UCI1_9BURK|nr:ankyrin repeat domain-containing protein [Burkholderia cenocepacia]MCW3696367.1 ankyrin repeat domain-containing protein [Burkholderia cenocepacia]MCW3704414.1 ankyrin repeat domain-containing protein [Burkholderia cenocepacia]MCW3712147.1 ankyrin repeat domain-containing protein [Burkholderia cenocepacia]MCW3720146.1 ankyrin repeat domain-containing protein [Burkholderia cenocepacia]MCW3727790.1 ankyrin repeat domain-containing protein [Burkholderia cenocepacia]